MRSRRLLGLTQLPDEVVAERAGVDGPGPAGQRERDRRSARAGARGQRLPHAALEDAGGDLVLAVAAPERDVGAVREQLAVLDRRAELGEVEAGELLRLDLD